MNCGHLCEIRNAYSIIALFGNKFLAMVVFNNVLTKMTGHNFKMKLISEITKVI